MTLLHYMNVRTRLSQSQWSVAYVTMYSENAVTSGTHPAEDTSTVMNASHGGGGATRERHRRIAKSCVRANVVQSFDTVITRMCVFEHNQNKDLWVFQATDLGNKVYQNRDI